MSFDGFGAKVLVQFYADKGELCGVVEVERAALCRKELEDGGGQGSVLPCEAIGRF